MLLAEDVLLLLTDDATGKPSVDSGRMDLALAGAVLLELAARGHVDVAGQGEVVRAGRVVVRRPGPTGDPLLDVALDRVAQSSPRKPESMLGQLKKGLAPEVRRRLTARGVLRYEQGRVLGIFPVDRWPAADSAHEEIVRRALHDVLVTGRLATPTEAGLVTILLAVDRLHRVVPSTGLSRRDLRSRAKVVADGHFAGEAVRKAIEAINAAIVSATVVTAVVAGGSS